MKRGKKVIQTSLGKLLTLKPSLSQRDQEAENPLGTADTNLNAKNEKSGQTATTNMAGHPTKPSEIVDEDADTCNSVENPIKTRATKDAVTILRTEESQEYVIDNSIIHVNPSAAHRSGLQTNSRAQRELTVAVEEFKEFYEGFATKHDFVLLNPTEFRNGIQSSNNQDDIRASAKTFEKEIANVLRRIREKQRMSRTKWTRRLGDFLTSLFPLAKFSLFLTSAVADVTELRNAN